MYRLDALTVTQPTGYIKYMHPRDYAFATVCLSVCQQEYLPKLDCGPMPNVMVALPKKGGALCSTPQSLADAHY